MMHEELSILRAAIENGKAGADSLAVSSAFPAEGQSQDQSQDSAASKEAIKKLETENSNLRGLLKELKEELLVTVASKTQSENDAKELKVSVAGKLQGDSDAKDSQITSLTEKLSSLQVTSDDHESKCQEVQGELEASKAAFSTLQTEMDALKEIQSSLQQGSAGKCSEQMNG